LSVQLVRAEALCILKDGCYLIAGYNFAQQRAIDIARLHFLALFSPTQDVATVFQNVVEEHDARSILKVTKGKAIWDALRVVHI
jgi:hypothetical protein